MLHFIIFAPLLGSIFSGFFYKKFNEKTVLYFTTSLIFISSIFSWITFFSLELSSIERIILFKWMESTRRKTFVLQQKIIACSSFKWDGWGATSHS